MPLADFLAGIALLAAVLGATGTATALIVRRRLSHLDPLEMTLASLVVVTALLIVAHLAPLVLGVMNRLTVLVACALVLGAAALVRPPAQAVSDEDRGPPPGPSTRAEWALAALAGTFVLAAALADLARWAGDELVGVDPLTFHMPNIGRWIQTGSVWQIDQFVPLQSQGYYPNNGDVLLLGAVLPWDNDFLVRFPTAFFALVTAVAVGAVARELRAPAAASVLAGATVLAIPIVGLASIPRALPDSLLWATLACGALFALRHTRTRRRSDLVLAAVALAIACGTKWYGVSSLAVAVVIWTAARLLTRRERVATVLGDGVVVGAIGVLGNAVWFVRNLIEAGNPLFPVNIEVLGVTLFDAPPDVLRDLAGFTVAGYIDDPDVLGQLARELLEGLGLLPAVCALGLLAAVALALRARPRDGRVLALAMAALALWLVYTLTPFSALGLKDDPLYASANTRYAVPALLLAAPITAWAIGSLSRAPMLLLEAGLAVAAVWGAYEGFELEGPRDVVLGVLGVTAMAVAVGALWRMRGRPAVLAVAAVLAAVVTLAALQRIEDRVNDDRYLSGDRAVAALLRAAPSGMRIGHASDWSIGGLSPIWPSFGTRIGNDVEFVGYFDEGWLRRYPDARSFQAALARGRYDMLVVGRGFFPPEATPEQRWAIDAGWQTVALSPRLRVLVPPAR